MVNFYSADNKRVAQKASDLTDEKEKYIRKDKCTTRVFKFSFDKPVARVTIDHINEGDTADDTDEIKGKKLNLPVSSNPLSRLKNNHSLSLADRLNFHFWSETTKFPKAGQKFPFYWLLQITIRYPGSTMAKIFFNPWPTVYSAFSISINRFF